MAWADLEREGQPVLAMLRLATVVHTDTQGKTGNKKGCDLSLIPHSLPSLTGTLAMI